MDKAGRQRLKKLGEFVPGIPESTLFRERGPDWRELIWPEVRDSFSFASFDETFSYLGTLGFLAGGF